MEVLLIIGVVALIGVIAYMGHLQAKKRREAFQDLARELGFGFPPEAEEFFEVDPVERKPVKVDLSEDKSRVEA